MKKGKKNDHMVEVDARVLAAGLAQEHEKKEPIELSKALITDPGTATLADGLEVEYDPALDYVTFHFGEKVVKVAKVDLWQFVFSICSAQVRDQLVPVRQTEVMHYHKVHTVQLKRDMRAGQTMKVRCVMSVPLTVVEGLKGMVEKQTKSSILLPGQF